MSGHVLVLEARLTGHHPVYLERIVDGLLRAGHRVTLALAAADADHPAMQRLRADWPALALHLFDDARIAAVAGARFGVAGREAAHRRLFGEAYRAVHARQPVDHVFLPYVDYCLHALALFGSPFGATRWSGICMGPSFHFAGTGIEAPRPALAAVKQRLFLRLLAQPTLARLFTIDEFLHAHVKARAGARAPRLGYLADPAQLQGRATRGEARARFGLADGDFVVLVYGAIDERKGLRPLLEALQRDDMPARVRLLLVGRQAAPARAWLEAPAARALAAGGRIVAVDRFVDDEEQHAAFQAADVVWLGYLEHYVMSGVLILAAQAGKPVLATRAGLIGWNVRRHGLGEAIAVEPAAIAAALARLQRDGHAVPPAAVEKFAGHTWDRLLAALEEALATR